MEQITKAAEEKIYHSSISVSAGDTSGRRGSKTGMALRRASAVLGKLLTPPQPSASAEDLGHQQEQNRGAAETRCEGGLSKILSGLYCETLVMVGLVLPVAEVFTETVDPAYYQVYYIYLCSVSLLYMVWTYSCVLKYRTALNIFNTYRKDLVVSCASRGTLKRYGSFYLRLGAIGFGVGSMVYCGLEFGEVVELREKADCRQWTALAVPLFRMALTIAQMQFIFLNSQNIDMCREKIVCKFGLMHLIATNICEWLSIIVQETKHEISHFRTMHNYSHTESKENKTFQPKECRGPSVMGSLVEDAAPILYPCTIEYSLICAVITYQMWQDVGRQHRQPKNLPPLLVRYPAARAWSIVSSEVLILDCANAYKGLLAGTAIIILTAASLILYLLSSGSQNVHALEAIDTWELIVHLLSMAALILAAVKLRATTYINGKGLMCLDTWLIIVGQSGVTLHCLFKITAVVVSQDGSLFNQLVALSQSLAQTLFIVHYWRYRTSNHGKPARQLITFLLLCNAGLWSISTLVRNKIASDEGSLKFYGPWGWIAMSRIAMPLNIFYRFHSTICLFEIWKNMYKPVCKRRQHAFPQLEASF